MKRTTIALCAATFAAWPALAAEPAKINWNRIPAVNVPLFYPGQSTYEWLRSDAHKGASKEVMRGDACTSCHDEEDNEKDLGAKLVKANPLEPKPVRAKNGFVELKVQAAYDNSNAYFRFQWKTQAPAPGSEYPYYRFDGKEWKAWGAPRLDAPVQEGKQPALYEDRLSMMVDDGKVPMFAQQGCWLSCHDGQRDSRRAAGKDDVAANEAMKAYGKTDVRKYLPESRSDPSDWRTGKSPDEIARIKAAGGFVDLIQWRANRSNPVAMGDDGWVLHWRNFDAGKNPFASNMDDKTRQPKYMFDAAKFGSKEVTANQVGRQPNHLTLRENAVPFDPNAGWQEGDMLPRYYLQPNDATGSAADTKASGVWKDGMWTVLLSRPLNLANDDDKAFKDGAVYHVGFAVHDDNITTRGHHVSWVRTVGFGARTKADIRAVKLP